MRALINLTIANIKSFSRDRAALFWTLAFPLIFVVLFGSIFSGGSQQRTIGFADEDGSAASASLKGAFAQIPSVTIEGGTQADLLARMKKGEISTVIVVPKGFGDTMAAGTSTADVTVFTDPSQSSADATTRQLVTYALASVNSRQPPPVEPTFQTIQTNDLTFISYLVPSILGMSLMRLQATPLRRWQLVGSNVLMRLLIAAFQTVIIVGVGSRFYDVEVSGSWLLIGALILLGSLAFIALGYVIASFAKTEDSANGMTSVVQFPLMFLSGTFFPIDAMPDVLKTVARAMPLTYLGDGLRQVMVDGTPFAPLWVCFAFLIGWLVVCFGIAARFFRWQ
jgi:ABC-2 type transport system permease protein